MACTRHHCFEKVLSMCFSSRRSHLCVICLLCCSVSPGSGYALHSAGADQKHTHGELIPVSNTDEQHLHDFHRDGILQNQEEDDSHKHPEVTVDYFLDELFTKYGNGVDMSFEGFEHLLGKLNLLDIKTIDHSLSCHRVNNSDEFISFHSNHNQTHSPCSKGNLNHSHEDHSHEAHNHEDHIHGDPVHEDHDDDMDTHEGHNHEDHIHEDHVHEDHVHEDHVHEDHVHEDHVHEDHDDDDMDTHESHNHNLREGDHDGQGLNEHKQLDSRINIDDEHVDNDHTEDNHMHDKFDSVNSDNVKNKSKVDKHDHDHSDPNHDHDHSDHNHDHDHSDPNHDYDHSDPNHDHDHSDPNHDHDHSDPNHDHDHSDPINVHDHSDPNHDHDHSDPNHDHDHSDPNHDHDHSDPNHEHNDEGHGHTNEGGATPPEKQIRKRRSVSEKEVDCMEPKRMLSLVKTDSSKGLTRDMFIRLCPALVYLIESDTCNSQHRDHDHDDQDYADASDLNVSGISPKVWGYSIISVLIISLVGVLGIVVVPIVEKVSYNHLLQFLVALAVGSLSGDALLHLLPHAIAGGHGDESEGHDLTPIYKGLCALLGIYFFFLTERILTIFTVMKKRNTEKKKNKRNLAEDEAADKVGEKLANSDMKCDEKMMSIHPNKALMSYADEAHQEHCEFSIANTSISHQHATHNHNPKDIVFAEEDVAILNPSSKGHGHCHSPCRDGVPKSVSAIAWMIILGDGVHNFGDGLAIGAAFANSITGGFSTSVAVFCHELPHEIGDFAVLLRAGMAPKQALMYNCVSSIFCLFGMLIGVAIGNIHSASLWVFAAVGGMFLYIALVDMLPELTSVETKAGENPYLHLFLQMLGMMLGAGIMLLIALYEDDLTTMFE